MKIQLNKSDPLDKREYQLRFIRNLLNPMADIIYVFTQRDLRLIMKHLKRRNTKLYKHIRCFIKDVDAAEGKHTNWHAKVPKTRNINRT